MIKFGKKLSHALGKIPKIKPKAKNETAVEGAIPKRVRHKQSWRSKNTPKLERTPAKDTFETPNTSDTKPIEKKKRTPVKRTNIGDVYTASKRQLAKQYLDDLGEVAQMVPGASFIREANSETALKKIRKIIEKLTKREDKYSERGYKEVIRDEIRARMFMLDADQNYEKIIEGMKKKKYRVAPTFEENAEGKLILDENGKAKRIPDIDVRFGEKAQPSGYQDVQIRFEKGDTLYELIVLPGPHYMFAADKEHAIYDQTCKYDSLGLTKDIGAKQIVEALKKEIGKVTKKLYEAAENRDRYGAASEQIPVTFTPEEIKTINGLFGSLRQLFLGKFNTLPPSKRTVKEFKDSKTAMNLAKIEQNIRTLLQEFKPKDTPKPAEVKD